MTSPPAPIAAPPAGPGARPRTGSRHPARARRARALRRRRSADALGNWALGTLVLGSLALAGVLWSGALWASSPVSHQLSDDRAYQVAGDVGTGGDTTGVVSPERIVLLFPGAAGDIALGDPADPDFVLAWTAMLSLLAHADVSAASPAGLKQVTAKLAAFSAPSPFSGGPACSAAGLEVDLGAVVPWDGWLQAATGTATAGLPGASVDRVILLPGGIAAAGAAATGGPLLYLLGGASALQAALPAAAYAPVEGALCALLGRPDSDAYAVAPLAPDGAVGGVPEGVLATVPDPGALLVPQPSALALWRATRLTPEPLSADSLALSIFPDPLEVRSTRSGASTVFTSAQNWMLTVNGSQATLIAPAAAGAAPQWYSGLVDALRYVDLRGGWPAGAWLSGVQSGGNCTILSCAAPAVYTYLFSTRDGPLPVLTAAQSPPAISVTIGGGGEATFYLRAVQIPSAGGAVSGASPATVSAAAAINAVYLAPPTGFAGRQFQVVGILPAWVPQGGVLEPAWAVELDQAPWGVPATALVDASSGVVLGVWSPT